MNPGKEQMVPLGKHFMACRRTCDHFLDARTKYYAENKNARKKGLTVFDTMKMLTGIKKEATWLNEVNSQSFDLRDDLRDLVRIRINCDCRL